MKSLNQYINENNRPKPIDSWKNIDFETAYKELKNGNKIYITNIRAFFKLISNNKLHIGYVRDIDRKNDGLKPPKDTISLLDFKKWYGPNNEYNIDYKFKIQN